MFERWHLWDPQLTFLLLLSVSNIVKLSASPGFWRLRCCRNKLFWPQTRAHLWAEGSQLGREGTFFPTTDGSALSSLEGGEGHTLSHPGCLTSGPGQWLGGSESLRSQAWRCPRSTWGPGHGSLPCQDPSTQVSPGQQHPGWEGVGPGPPKVPGRVDSFFCRHWLPSCVRSVPGGSGQDALVRPPA